MVSVLSGVNTIFPRDECRIESNFCITAYHGKVQKDASAQIDAQLQGQTPAADETLPLCRTGLSTAVPGFVVQTTVRSTPALVGRMV